LVPIRKVNGIVKLYPLLLEGRQALGVSSLSDQFGYYHCRIFGPSIANGS
jgi:hypothetical protein